VKIRTRIILTFTLLVAVGFYFLVDYIIDDLRPRYLESVEEALVDQANVLAALVESQIKNGEIQTDSLRKTFQRVPERGFSAQIYRLLKTRVDERIYVTDDRGIVLFDSEKGKEEGRDFSQWRDVFLTLRGEYGARTTRGDPSNPTSSILHVSAPVRWEGRIVGVLTVSKPTASINFFLQTARPQILIAGVSAALSAILLGIVFSLWVTRPIQRLTGYARAVRDGKTVRLPDLGNSEMGEMGAAFEEMREALEGKKYVEHYVQSLTHELKSPLAAVRGAAELMQEEMPKEERDRFLSNIRMESARMEQVVERMLELASLEARKGLLHLENLEIRPLVEDAVRRVGPVCGKKKLSLQMEVEEGLFFQGERFLMEEAILNLLQNAVDFSPSGGRIRILGNNGEGYGRLIIEDEGPGIPDYAHDRIFDKFYSLQRPDTGKKSTGLGLSFVKEVISLHGGIVKVGNKDPSGARAEISLPLSSRIHP
jgi:two-component system, OmpR family, sensor histidine kinase CreC